MRTQTKKAGRPPAGPAGEKTSEYPTLTIRLPRATKNAVVALGTLTHTPAWKVIAQAVDAHVAQLPAPERRLLAQILDRMKA